MTLPLGPALINLSNIVMPVIHISFADCEHGTFGASLDHNVIVQMMDHVKLTREFVIMESVIQHVQIGMELTVKVMMNSGFNKKLQIITYLHIFERYYLIQRKMLQHHVVIKCLNQYEAFHS